MEDVTKILSARIPASLMLEIDRFCAGQGKTRTQFVRESFGMVTKQPMPEMLPDPSAEVMKQLIAVGGGSMIGVIVYKAVRFHLTEKEWDKTEAELIAFACALVAGITTTLGASKLMSDNG